MEKVYETYKNGDGFWFKKVPKEWSFTNLNLLTDFIMGQAPHSSTYNQDGIGELFIKTGDFGLERPIPKWYTSKPLVYAKEEDVFMCVVGATAGKVNLGIDGTISRSIAAIRPRNMMIQKFLYYYLQCNYSRLNDMSEGSAQGIINKDILSSIKIPIPTKQEQTQIAAYLDYHTQLIDTLISKKETLIQKLQEQRQAIINEAVTKGVTSSAVEMKDSGIEWLGQIPEHWEVKKAKYLLNEKDGIKIGPFGSSLKLDTLSDSGIKIYGQGNVIKDDFELGHRYLSYERFENEFTQYEILPGDILVTMMGTTGRSKVFEENFQRGILDSHLLRLRLNKNKFSGYLFSILLQEASYISQQVDLNSVGAIMAGLNSKIIKELDIVTPPIEEQMGILDFIERESNLLDKSFDNINNSIQKLKDYRQSLISEAVTGKIDVRDWQQPNN